jgi:CelD/BcsL family acetyltransferase involved in cellulose biosynthesis
MGIDTLVRWAKELDGKVYCDEVYKVIDASNLSSSHKHTLNAAVASITDDKMRVSPGPLMLAFNDHRRLYHSRQ